MREVTERIYEESRRAFVSNLKRKFGWLIRRECEALAL